MSKAAGRVAGTKSRTGAKVSRYEYGENRQETLCMIVDAACDRWLEERGLVRKFSFWSGREIPFTEGDGSEDQSTK
ncbi:MAG TPA: hypothetical protein VIT91_08120 [Chthoniobacterales bacterium]